MRLFSFEYIRKILKSDEVNFLSDKKKTQLKIKSQTSPFISNNRTAGQQAEKCLQEFKFSESFKWNYDPLGVIGKIKIKFKLTPFVHESKPDIEKHSNHSEWFENTLKEVEKQGDTSSILQTPTPQDRNSKRLREEGSY